MTPDEERPAEGGNPQRTNDENAPSESITASVPPAPHVLNVERIRLRARLRAAEQRRIASRELNTYAKARQDDLGFVRHSQRWERSWANWLVREWGFDAAYVARRHGLKMRTGA